MSRALRAMLAYTPLVRNLKNDEYLAIILNGHSTLSERFADIDAKNVRENLKQSTPDKLLLSESLSEEMATCIIVRLNPRLACGHKKNRTNCSS